MNERIQELSVAAGGYEVAPHDFLFRQEQLQKFAELIIRECTNMLPEDSVRSKEGVHMFYVIREHFGISGIGR